LIAIGAAALCGSACQPDDRFDTVAQYEAPRGGYRLAIHASGVVKAGDDLSRSSQADVTIAPASAHGSTVRFTAALPDSSPPGSSLARLVADAGYESTPDELDECRRAIDGALAGPKGTLMDGQTRVLRVVEVTFDRR
jgi:hypothetical protein